MPNLFARGHVGALFPHGVLELPEFALQRALFCEFHELSTGVFNGTNGIVTAV